MLSNCCDGARADRALFPLGYQCLAAAAGLQRPAVFPPILVVVVQLESFPRHVVVPTSDELLSQQRVGPPRPIGNQTRHMVPRRLPSFLSLSSGSGHRYRSFLDRNRLFVGEVSFAAKRSVKTLTRHRLANISKTQITGTPGGGEREKYRRERAGAVEQLYQKGTIPTWRPRIPGNFMR